jgi:putative copper resistance protein D
MDTVSAPSAKQSSQQSAAGGPLRPAAITAEGIGKLWLLAAAAVVVLALVAALIYSGAAATRQLSDPGALTRWGLPAAKAVHNLALAAVIGSLVFAVAIVPKRRYPRP